MLTLRDNQARQHPQSICAARDRPAVADSPTCDRAGAAGRRPICWPTIHAANCARVWNSSLPRTCSTRTRTGAGLITSLSAIWRLVRPRARRIATCRSRWVSASTGGTLPGGRNRRVGGWRLATVEVCQDGPNRVQVPAEILNHRRTRMAEIRQCRRYGVFRVKEHHSQSSQVIGNATTRAFGGSGHVFIPVHRVFIPQCAAPKWPPVHASGQRTTASFGTERMSCPHPIRSILKAKPR